VLVSGNFFNCDPSYLALADDVDLIITEMRNTTYRQPEWYRYVRAFAGDKDVVVVENPYGGVVPELVELLGRGRGRDLLRLSLYEGAAFGANMTAPFGSWMGATIEDSFYAPHDLVVEIQSFLADNDRLFASQTYNEVAVVYSVESARALISQADASDNLSNATDESVRVPYRVVTRGLAAAGVPYDVVLFPDGVTAPDRVGEEALSRYRTIVLPDCHHLTDRQAAALKGYLDGGGCAVVLGGLGENLEPSVQEPLASHPRSSRADLGDVAALTPSGPQVGLSAGLTVNVARPADGAAAVHLLDYRYERDSDGVAAIDSVDVSVRLPFEPRRATLVSPEGGSEPLAMEFDGDTASVRLPSFRLYGVVVFDEEPR
jgi:hypothetical protein